MHEKHFIERYMHLKIIHSATDPRASINIMGGK